MFCLAFILIFWGYFLFWNYINEFAVGLQFLPFGLDYFSIYMAWELSLVHQYSEVTLLCCTANYKSFNQAPSLLV
jgi:hypothetical protein